MSEELKRIYYDALRLKNIILENKNIEILLYLAKYNPKVSEQDLEKKFGKDALKGLRELKNISLVKEEGSNLFLTNEGIFQVEGLLTMAV
ncbi:MAG: hypothetical protein J4415_02210 [Candidatus Diapherotrites archaeon]|uniref:Uncharacterized protein n=1 Tax=Candidatus Iainarchaeum sp. TaxID=3101447 RepID=A0A8T4KQM4_9ARCH|nr:hypothetical protein [Candidatus Diapherotrites archaeon]